MKQRKSEFGENQWCVKFSKQQQQQKRSRVSFMLSIHSGSLSPSIKSIVIIYTPEGELLQYKFFMGS